MPKARIAVIDGNRYAPSQPLKRDGLTIKCLWGEIAYQIGGEQAYSMVADSDDNGTSPGKEVAYPAIGKIRTCCHFNG